jgi:cytochrome c biogenesis protein CcdA/glutaredoxin
VLAPFGSGAASVPAPEREPVQLLLFHGDGCPHCATARDFLAGLQIRWPQLIIEEYEVWNDTEHHDLFRQVMADRGTEPRAVPTIVVGDRVWVGFSDAIGADIEAVVAALHAGPEAVVPTEAPEVVGVPFFGDIDVGDRSLVLSTVLIGFVDGVNPCSLWVLSVLLALVLHSGSRARVLTVGSVFLVITSALYGLYMVGAYSALDYAGETAWIRVTVATVAGVFGLLHLKEYVTSSGVSLTIPDAKKPPMYQRMRKLASAERSLPAVLGGTAVLAVGVSLMETPCTAGLPLLWSNMLASRDVATTGAILLFALYLAVFLLDELVLFGIAVVTLRATKLQEHHGRALQLVSGTLMVVVALARVFRPSALESLTGTLGVFGAAGAIVGVVLVIQRWVPSRSTSHVSH